MDAGADALGGGDAQFQEAVEPAGRRLRRRSGDFEAFQAFPDARRRVGVGVDAGSHRPTGNWRPALSDLVWGAFLPMECFGEKRRHGRGRTLRFLLVGAFPPFPPFPPLLRGV